MPAAAESLRGPVGVIRYAGRSRSLRGLVRPRWSYFELEAVYDAMSSRCSACDSCWIFFVSSFSIDPPIGLVPKPVNGAVVK
jgi:hypothetical protein